MTDQQTKVDTIADVREASKSRVTTLENLLPVQAVEPTSEAVADVTEKVAEVTKEAEDKPKVKKSPQERIQELANLRREAENKAADATRENEELKAKIKALEVKAPAIQVDAKPDRTQYVNDSDYVEAYADWKTKRVLADREAEQRQAKANATAEQVKQAYDKTKEVARLKYDDFDAVVSASRTALPDFLYMAIMESPVGGDLTYYLAKHQDELNKLIDVAIVDGRPIQALKRLDKLENALLADDSEYEEKEIEKPKVKRAPDPINPLSGTNAQARTKASSFEEYRSMRKAGGKK